MGRPRIPVPGRPSFPRPSIHSAPWIGGMQQKDAQLAPSRPGDCSDRALVGSDAQIHPVTHPSALLFDHAADPSNIIGI
jgi:hypothetical protein